MADKVQAGGNGVNGRITVIAKDGQPMAELIAADAEAIIAAGQKGGRPGRLTLYDGDQQVCFEVRASTGKLGLGGGGQNARLTVRADNGNPVAEMIAFASESVIAAGSAGRPGRLSLYDGNSSESIQLNAASGDLLLMNADCAEEFDVEGRVVPGSVVVLNDDGSVRCADAPYDSRVIGVISGAGDYQPGIVLDRRPTGRPRLPVALMGKVWCLADARHEAIATGDLLTTAAQPGHAMRASDCRRLPGAIIGKALRPLAGGTGMVPMLVTLR